MPHARCTGRLTVSRLARVLLPLAVVALSPHWVTPFPVNSRKIRSLSLFLPVNPRSWQSSNSVLTRRISGSCDTHPDNTPKAFVNATQGLIGLNGLVLCFTPASRPPDSHAPVYNAARSGPGH